MNTRRWIMSDYWHEILGRQHVATVEMLRNAIESCPDELWDDRSDGTPVWHIAYHALFFCDMYLSDDLDSFEARDYHVDYYHYLPGDYKEYGGVVTTPEQSFSKEQMMEYAEHCMEKCRTVFESLT
jgi:hypothetical protein